MIPRSLLTEVIEKIDGHSKMTPHELSTHIICGLYTEMRKRPDTPKATLLVAACEVLQTAILERGYRLDLKMRDMEDPYGLALLLIHFADEVSQDT